jgi:iron only hydrogenase large subunit-like protein
VRNPDIDYVLTYEELDSFFEAKQIIVAEQEEATFATDASTAQARRFAVSGGVAGTVTKYAEKMGIEVKATVVDGLDKGYANSKPSAKKELKAQISSRLCPAKAVVSAALELSATPKRAPAPSNATVRMALKYRQTNTLNMTL